MESLLKNSSLAPTKCNLRCKLVWMVACVSVGRAWVSCHQCDRVGKSAYLWARSTNSIVQKNQLNVGGTVSMSLSSIYNFCCWRLLLNPAKQGSQEGVVPQSPDPIGHSGNQTYILSWGVSGISVKKASTSPSMWHYFWKDELQNLLLAKKPARGIRLWCTME